MLRLEILSQNSEQVVLAVHGWIAGDDIALLKQGVEPWLKSHRQLVLDLTGVRFIDEAGAELLRHWIGQGAVLHDGSAFLRALLQEYDLA